jgi:hypothetical protein
MCRAKDEMWWLGWDGITGGYLFEEAQEKKKESM